MSYKKINNITGWVVFLIATIVYLLTAEETTSLWDCGEYITTANKLEVGHPPGAPFFMMLGRLFSAFSSPENAAYMVNALSALSSSATVLFMFWSLTMFAKKLANKGSNLLDKGHIVAIMGTGFVGAMAYAFTDSFWFSAVEGEVYAMSSFFTAIVFWAILKWEVEVDVFNNVDPEKRRGNPNRWIIFIAYMIGLSIGVHLLNLLAIPAIAFVIYFKKYEFNVKTFLIAGVISVVTLGLVQAVIIPKLPSIADWFERLFVNSLGMPFNTGAFFFLALLAGGLGYGIYYTAKKQKAMWNTLILSFTVLLIGYSSFTMIVVRSNANPPLDENNPETLSALVSYLNRDQYGTWPVLYGQYWNTPQKGSCDAKDLLPAKVSNMKVYTLEGMHSRYETKNTEKKTSTAEAKIGNQVWMTKNLNVAKFRNGDPIPQATNMDEWNEAASNQKPMWCYYNFNRSNEDLYGKLYNWFAVDDSRGLAPKGWRIPLNNDFKELNEFLGDESAGLKMKNDNWEGRDGNNSSNMNCYPAGFCFPSGMFSAKELDIIEALKATPGMPGEGFQLLGQETGYWTSEEGINDSKSRYVNLYSTKDKLGFHIGLDKGTGVSVRCVKSANKDTPRSNNINKINELISNLGLNATVVPSTKNPGENIITIIGEEQSFMNMFELEDYQSRVAKANEQLAASGIDLNIQFGNEIGEKYINTFAHRPKGEKTYNKQFMTLFPRMYRQGEGTNYRIWCGYEGDINNPLPPTYRYFGQVPGMTTRSQEYQRLLEAGYEKEAAGLEKDGLYKPTMGENISFFKDYQINWMYVRYFLWNFAGRQNDTQGYGLTGPGSEILDGNWLSGVNFIDNQRLGAQENLPTIQRLNKGYNKYYLLPLILALIGFIFHIVKSPKDWFVILLLFLLTGLAIVVFLNQKPNEPRERDYAYAASFYAFAFWIGIGVYALFDAARNMKWKDLGLVAAYSLGAGVVLYGLETAFSVGAENANHAFSYTVFYMSAIALALHATMILIGNAIKDNLSHAAISTGMCLVVPFILIYQNWDDHDRSNRSTARDFAYNYLASCDQNAMLFTNGDNDTFPLWYIQDVEGVRTDVRVANMSLLSTDWHINQMKRKAWDSDPLPITLNEFDYRNGTRDFVIFDESPSKKGKWYSAKEAINFIMNDQHLKQFPGMCNPESYIDFRGVYIPVDKEAALKNGIVTQEQAHLMEDTIKWNLSGGALYKADLAVLDILANYKWDRPINFASLGGIGANKGIAKYMQAEGVTYKLTPILFGGGGGTNTEKMYDLVMNDKFLWGNMKKEGVLVDYYTLRMVQNLRMQMMKLSDALISEGKNEKAVAILDKTFEIMPIDNNQVAPDDICFYLVGNYYDAANALSATSDSTLYIETKAKGDKIGKQLALLELEKIDHYQSLNEHFFDKVWTEWGRSLNNLEMLRQASIGGLDQEAMIASDPTNTFFTNQGALEGTGYSTTLISAKQIFLKKGYTKQKFFSNPQRFPVVLAQYCWMNK